MSAAAAAATRSTRRRRRPRRGERGLGRSRPGTRSAAGPRVWSATMTAYLEQLAVSSRPATVSSSVDGVAPVRCSPAPTSDPRLHRRWPRSSAATSRPTRSRSPPARDATAAPSTTETIRNSLGMLRTFFERIIDWDYPDAPDASRCSPVTSPTADEPLPKFLDDPTAAKFMAALAVEPNRRRRLIVELLARTGMRVGEIGGLRDDAMYRLGDTWWLRIPIGKLHNDRTVPLHPMLVGLINDYRAWRGPDRHRAPRRTRRPPTHRPAHHLPLRRRRRPPRRRRPRPPPRPAPHPGHPMHQPGHVPRSHRRAARPPLTTHDPRLRPHLRHHRRRAVLQRHPSRRSRNATTVATASRHRADDAAAPPAAPRQRPLHPTTRARLPLPDHLRRLRLLRDRPPVRHHPAPPTRRRRRPHRPRPHQALRRADRRHQRRRRHNGPRNQAPRSPESREPSTPRHQSADDQPHRGLPHPSTPIRSTCFDDHSPAPVDHPCNSASRTRSRRPIGEVTDGATGHDQDRSGTLSVTMKLPSAHDVVPDQLTSLSGWGSPETASRPFGGGLERRIRTQGNEDQRGKRCAREWGRLSLRAGGKSWGLGRIPVLLRVDARFVSCLPRAGQLRGAFG